MAGKGAKSTKLDRILDRKSYEEIERSDPELISEIERLIWKEKWSPNDVKHHIFQHSRQRWPLAVQSEQAARWVEFQAEND